jgi:hypothetical protein
MQLSVLPISSRAEELVVETSQTNCRVLLRQTDNFSLGS